MNNMTHAHTALLQKSLDKLYRFNGVIQTLEQYLDNNQFAVIEREESKIEYNRHKFNAMNYEQQAEYQKRLDVKTTRYYAYFTDGTMLNLPKLVANHYREV